MTTAEKVIAFIEKYCFVPEGALVGSPIKLEDFQKRFIFDVYDNPQGTTHGILSIGRKNGKTALIACLLLAHLVGPVAILNSQIVSGALSREQAALVFNLAVKMIQLNPKLNELVDIKPSGKRLIGRPMGVEYKALAADGKTAQGLSPVLAILDEVGQVQGSQSAFVDAITTAQGAHKSPLLLTISTQAANDADLLSIWIDDAINSGDPHTVCHVYSADKDLKITDPKAWKQANPALGVFRSEDDIKKLADKANRMPSFENTFRNLNLNQRVSTVSTFVTQDVWKANGEIAPPPMGLSVYGGLDLSARTDLTSLVLVAKEPSGKTNVYSYFWTPEQGLIDRTKRDRSPYDVWAKQGFIRTTPGATVDYAHVVRDIAEILSDFDISSIAFDRWRMDIFKKEMDAQGITLPLVPFGQGFKDMSPAIDTLESQLLNGQLRHGMHPVLTMCAANAVITKDPAGNRKFEKHKATGRIDGMVALAMALGIAESAETPLNIDAFLQDMIIG
ncbi:terminase large subunit [Gallibacterium anatis]|uniref:Terminase n=1 Tax=Gallibacterium anatis TaxID=750 RepID=A0A1A7P4U5_9PAST|nr:terminase TerL endonuclease subunit [Gallibacterium anatis]OBW97472.1 terminase [Gallibacterium anatis]OBX00875.1 terminase [Gallibacterium anatis]